MSTPNPNVTAILPHMQELQRKESIYRRLVEHMNEAVWMGDKDERTVYANPKFCELMGYTLEEMMGKESYEFWDKESADRVRQANLSERKRGKSSTYEGNLLTKNGERIPVLLSGTPLLDGGTIGIMTDMRELKEKESIYRRLVEHMNEAVWMGDKDERTVYANPKFCELMGYTLEEMMGKESYEFWDKESADRVRQANLSERKRGKSSTYEGNLLTKNGERIPVLLSGTALLDGGTIGIMTDMRELKEKEEKERVLSRAISYATDGIIIVSRTGEIESWNKGAKLIFGYTEKSILGKKLELLFPSDEVENMLKQSKIRYNFETKGIHKNKKQLSISATVSPLIEEGSTEASSFLIITRDITEQRKFEEELSQKYRKMREAYNNFGIIRRQMDYIFELTEMAMTCRDTKSLGDFIVNSVIMLSRVDGCVLRTFDPKKKALNLLSSFGVSEDWMGKAAIPFQGSLVEKAFASGQPLQTIDLGKEPGYTSAHLAKKHNFSSLLTIPIVFQSKLLGSLSLYVTPEKKLELFENEFVEQYARLIGVALATSLSF